MVHPNTEGDQIDPQQAANLPYCDGSFIDLKYEFEGISGLTLVSTNTLATLGLTTTNSYTNTPSVQISIVSSATAVNEAFQIEIVEPNGGARTRRWNSTSGAEGPNAVASALAAVIDTDPEVSASAVGRVITINAIDKDYVFWVRVNKNAVAGSVDHINNSKIRVTDATPVKGTLSLTGTLTLNISNTTSYTLVLTNINQRCDSYTTTTVISVDPGQIISTPTPTLLNQEFCDGETFSGPAFVLDGTATGYKVTWSPALPRGVTFDALPSNNIGTATFTLKGTLNTGVTTSTAYYYTLVTEGTGCNTNTISGSIVVKPVHKITLTAGQANQLVCNVGSPIQPIEYTFSGGANTYNISWTGGPIGLNVLNTSSKTLTISGTVNITGGITTTTSYTYIIKTIGNDCQTDTVSGVITVLPQLGYSISTPGRINQINSNAICNGDPIQDIKFSVIGGEGAAQVSLTWTTNQQLANVSVTPDGTNTNWTISGPTNNILVATDYPYKINIFRPGTCVDPVSFTGTIRVIPVPQIDGNFIQLNDITNVSCKGGSDGSIIIPVSPTIEFEKRIKGGQLAAKQTDSVTISATSNLSGGNIIRVFIDGNSFEAVAGAGQTTSTVLQSLADQINFGVNSSKVDVFASVINTPALRIEADTAGIGFTVSGTTVISGTNTITTLVSSVVSNVALNYTFNWYNSSNLLVGNQASLENVTAGDYTLEVSINSCVANTVSFTIEEPDALTVSYTACQGVLSATVSGGVAPYTLTLFDANNTQIDQVNSNGGKRYTGLAAGANYRLEVLDSSCAQMQFINIRMPYGLNFDVSKTRVVDDYCRESPTNLGGGSIEMDINGMAFTGGSDQFSFIWVGPNNYSNSTMNISNLVPGAYTVTVTDNQLGCDDTQTFTVGGPAATLTVADSGITTPAPVAGKITLNCHGEEVKMTVQAAGGMFNNYTYTWFRNGVQIASGAQNSYTTTQTGVYSIIAEVNFPNDPNLLPAHINSTSDMYCAATTSFTVEGPTAMIVTEINSKRIIPACSNDGAQLVFNVIGGSDNSGPYTLTLQGGTLTGSSANATSREITISNIDTNNIGTISNYTISNANGCSYSGTFNTPITLPNYEELAFQVTTTDFDCAQSQQGSVEFSLAKGSPDLSTLGIRIESTVLNYNYFTNWANASAGGGNPTISLPRAGTYTYKIIGTPVSGNTTSTAICDIDSGSFEIKDTAGDQLILNDIKTTQPGCGVETGLIQLVFEESTIPPTLEINWEKLITTTTSSSTTQEWKVLPSKSGNLTVSGLENGSYRAKINANTGGLCGNDNFTTRSIIIGNSAGIIVKNIRYEEASRDCNDVTDFLYDIKFTLENNLADTSGNGLEIVLTKISNYGKPFNTTYQSANLNPNNASNGGSGAYTISDVPFGEYQMVVRETGTATQTVCETNQAIFIPEIQSLEYVGELEYVLDNCTGKIDITADVQGGVPFISASGDSFYSYSWTLDLGGGNTFNYIGKEITISQAGDLYLTISDSSGCKINVTETTPIKITENITPYEIIAALPSGEFSEEPSCQNSKRDDGKIKFEVMGGESPLGSQYPYEIIWEKYDASTGNYNIQDGTNGQDNLYMQTFSNNLTPGQYKISVAPLNWDCVGVNPYESIGAIEYITVAQNEDLVITNGPVIDVSEYDFSDPNQLTICEVGGAGYLYIKVFDNYEGTLNFYYPTQNTLVPHEKIDNTSYKIQISSSVAVGDLTVENEEGCKISKEIRLDIGTPNFSYSSLNSQITGNSTQTQMPLILAREEVTFTNTSSGTFSYVEWDFGDGSPVERYIPLAGSTSPVTHIYGISGTYYAKLRLYNGVGCYQEVIKTLMVGKGYNILVPNVFTPNGDTYNDTFRPLFSGFNSIQMTIYDYRGNMLYMEESLSDPAKPFQPISLTGWSGDVATESPYYIYSVYGVTLFGNIEVQKSGTFIMIK